MIVKVSSVMSINHLPSERDCDTLEKRYGRVTIAITKLCISDRTIVSDFYAETFTHHNEQHEVDPVPEAVSILYIIHYIRPSLQRNNLCEWKKL